MLKKYASWTIDCKKEIAYTRSCKNLSLKLTKNKIVKFESQFGEINGAKNIISGICLFDARWLLEFEAKHRNPAGKNSLASPMEREKAFKKIKKGLAVKKIYYPIKPGEYHKKLINWQVSKFNNLKPKRILYHLPTLEYHCFIETLENYLTIKLPTLKKCLELFAKNIKDMLLFAMDKNKINKNLLEIIQPMNMGATDPNKSFLLPYLHPKKFGIKKNDLIGVEDLIEIKLSTLSKKETGYQIPTILAIIDIPHPFLNKNINDNDTKVITL